MKKKSLTIFLLPLIIIALCSSTLVVYTQSKINDSKTQFNQSYYNKQYFTTYEFVENLYNIAYLANLQLNGDPNLSKTDNVENLYCQSTPNQINYDIVNLINYTENYYKSTYNFLNYQIKNKKTGEVYNSKQAIDENNLENYQYYLKMSFDSEGYISCETDNPEYYANFQNFYRSYIDSNLTVLNSNDNELYTISLLKDTDIIFAIDKDISLDNVLAKIMPIYYSAYPLGIEDAIVACILILTIIGLMLPVGKLRQFSIYKTITDIPIEMSVCFSILIALLTLNLSIDNAISTFDIKTVILLFSSYFLLLFTYLMDVVIFKYAISYPIIPYFKSNSFTGNIINWSIQHLKSFDLNDGLTLEIVRIVCINALLVLFLFAAFNFIGVFVYSIILFFLLSAIFVRVKKDYKALLEATSSIASGNFETSMNSNLGIFNSYRDSMGQIKDDFKQAIEREIKSEKMKSELITSVSHDLKTPLTSIVTYVDLLKNQNIEADKKQEYIEVIDRNALRLKNLINDLFEVSKASSGNIQMNYMDIDIIALIKQVLFEYEQAYDQKHLEVKFNSSSEKIILKLDSQKTYRILTNLFTNILKYALENTRVYIDIKETDYNVNITIRNISKYEIQVEAHELLERFVQGDSSRHYEGSGLGLAIAKSFCELQHGTFEVSVEGDLFKTVLTFKK
ncbi:MAG: sensor histidine kinase [Beduini sp.]